MLRINHALIEDRLLPFPLECHNAAIEDDNVTFIEALLANGGQLPNNPPFEIHPYKLDFPLQNYDKYIVGTFPPISYVLDNPLFLDGNINHLLQPNHAAGNVIQQPWIPFYHGNQGSMWQYLLTQDEYEELLHARNAANGRQNAKAFLIDFLNDQQINYTDIIDSTQRSLHNGMYKASDANLNNICPNQDLICHLLSNPEAKFLLFNTASIFSMSGIALANGFVNPNKCQSFDLFVRQCQELGLIVKIQILHGVPENTFEWANISHLHLPQRRTKMAFEMKITNPPGNQILNCNFKDGERIFNVITPFSPAAVNRGRLRQNAIVANWLDLYHTPAAFLTSVYQNFREDNHIPIYNLNV